MIRSHIKACKVENRQCVQGVFQARGAQAGTWRLNWLFAPLASILREQRGISKQATKSIVQSRRRIIAYLGWWNGEMAEPFMSLGTK